MTPPISHHIADIGDVQLHYVRAGDGDPMVFVHGYPRHWYLWRNQLDEFSADHTVVAYDQRGYNLSSKPEGDLHYGVWIAVEDLRGLVDHLGLERFTLVAHDVGGAVAWSFALHYPERVDRLVVMSCPHPALLDRALHDDPTYRERAQFMRLLGSPTGGEMFAANDFQLLRPTIDLPFIDDVSRDAYLEAWRQPGAARSMLASDRREGFGPATADGTPARGNYAPEMQSLKVEVPTLVLFADGDDFFHPCCFQGLDEYVARLTLTEMHGTHWIPEEQPEVANKAVRSFLTTLDN
jgi:pimeloyl-ACP methyl ester carboxylesterase